MDDLKKSGNGRSQNRHLKPIEPGEVRNPRGRPIGSRSKFSEAMVSDFLADWHEHGTDVLARVRMTEPATYLRVAAVLVPKEMKLAVEHAVPAGLDPEQWEAVRRLAATMKEIAPNAGPDEIEHVLRSGFAKPVE
jgi:hypothetical protein